MKTVNFTALSALWKCLPNKCIGFNPVEKGDYFRTIWSLGTGWGNVIINGGKIEISIIGGELRLTSLRLPYLDVVKLLEIDGKKTECVF